MPLNRINNKNWEIVTTTGEKLACVRKRMGISGFRAKSIPEYFIYFTDDPGEVPSYCKSPKVVIAVLKRKLGIEIEFDGK